MSRPRLRRGDLPPRIVTPPPGPRSRALARRIADSEAPGVNTLAGGGARRQPAASLVWELARGANVLDLDGNRYLDLTSGFGVAAVGHRHPRVVAAIRRQSGRLLHALGDVHSHPLRVELAERLAALAPVRLAGDRAAVYFGISGAEAVEIALETALLATGRPGILAFDPAYHGLTLGALAATSRPAFRAPFAPWLQPHVARLPFGCPLDRVEAVLRSGVGAGAEAGARTAGTAGAAEAIGADAGPPSGRRRRAASAGDGERGAGNVPVGCVIVEPVVGREGVLFPPEGWLAGLAAACREAGALLVADEVFTGFGRTGTLFAVEREAVEPDLLVCGKALGGGLPMAAVLARHALFEPWRGEGEALHTATFLANPLACAAALAVLAVLAEDDLPARAARLGPRVAARLTAWPSRYPHLTAVRGRGLLWGLELADAPAARRLVEAALARGLLLLAGGPDGRVAQLVPPLTITEPQLDQALDLLEDSLHSLHG